MSARTYRKPIAIINGRLLQLGDAYDEMRLTRVDETGAVLTGARGRTVLALTPPSIRSRSLIDLPNRVLAGL